MALSPADFAAYSRAIGAPYPESPEERALMVPEVRAFRQNQLQAQPKQDSETTALGFGIGLGLAAMGGGAMALRKGKTIPKKPKTDTAGKSRVKMTDLSRVRQPAPGESTAYQTAYTGPEVPTQAERTSLRRKPENLYRDLVDKYPDPGAGKDIEYRPSYKGEFDEIVSRQDMMITDPQTGIKYRRGSSALSEADRAVLERRQRIQEINEYPDAPRKSNRPLGGPLAIADDKGANDVIQASRQLAREQYANSLLDERVEQLLQDLQVDVRREAGQMTGSESNRQSAVVRRIQAEEERQAKNILSELAQETPTLTETYETFGEPAARIQSIDAVDTASDQAAAPIERAVQRNEDVDLSAAQSFLNQQRQDLQSKGLSPTRVERVLASNPELIEAAELYASTGDEAVLSRFSEQPSSPVVVKPKTALAVTEELPTGQLFKSGTFGEFVDDLEGKDVNLTNRISSIGAEQQELVGRRKQLEEDSLMIKSAMDREPADKDSYSRMYGQMQYEMQNMPEPASLNVDIGDAMAERNHVRAQLKGLNELGAQQFLIDQTEGMRPFYEVNPATSEIIPETLEIRPGRKAIELSKGGGGRNVSEFSAGGREDDLVQRTIFVPTNEKGTKSPFTPVTTKTRAADDAGNQLTGFDGDRTQTGGRVGLYGPERTGRKGERATAGQRPTQVTEDELINQALMDSTADELGVPTPPDRDLVFVDRQAYQRPASRVMDSLKASEAVRRAKIEGRDPQQVLRSMGFGV